jgi:hypothetical protein
MKTLPLMRSLIALVILFSAFQSQANLITNGNFDISVPLDGTGGGWTASGNDANGGYRTVNGNSFFIMNASGQSGTDPSISQTLTGLTIGQQYDVSGDFTDYYGCCDNGYPAALSFGIALSPGSLLLEASHPGSVPDWFTFATSFVASAESHDIIFTSERNGTDYAYAIDNIFVTAAVPEPSIIALFGLGLVGIGFVRRRQS